MKILVVHNFYIEPGGEDQVFRAEAQMLKENGHDVRTYEEHNSRAKMMGRFKIAASFIWNKESASKFGKELDDFKPDLVHFHNIFLLLSPAVYYECKKRRIPVVQSLHNSRLICPAARFFRDGHLCMECAAKNFPWPGVQYRCYHHSRLQTFLVGLMSFWHRQTGTWHKQIDAYIVFSEFYRQVFVKWGLPKEKIVIKPHFLIKDPGSRPAGTLGEYALFVGRLSADKGIRKLLNTFLRLKDLRLIIIGDGEERAYVEEFIKKHSCKNIRLLGQLPHLEVMEHIKRSKFVVVPSEVAETFGLVVLESFACGVPVVASKLGALPEMVKERGNGRLFMPGNGQQMIEMILGICSDPQKLIALGEQARKTYELRYTKEKNYQQLMDIYKLVMEKYAPQSDH
ncbi:MAG: glycosyltransferase family 4 protein [Candidatus Omnitrophica bacterium]|nr:glycosyltransferase family 4 protein [Candidatus Omnitrophota bacterium]